MTGSGLIACHECDLLQREAADGAGYGALVAAHARALAAVSRDIAAAIRATMPP